MYRICGSHKARSNITSDFSNLKAITVAAEKTECISASAIVINYHLTVIFAYIHPSLLRLMQTSVMPNPWAFGTNEVQNPRKKRF